MSKYHIGENGPAVCRASVRPCPVGGDHFDSQEEAAAAFEASMGNSALDGQSKLTRVSLSEDEKTILDLAMKEARENKRKDKIIAEMSENLNNVSKILDKHEKTIANIKDELVAISRERDELREDLHQQRLLNDDLMLENMRLKDKDSGHVKEKPGSFELETPDYINMAVESLNVHSSWTKISDPAVGGHVLSDGMAVKTRHGIVVAQIDVDEVLSEHGESWENDTLQRDWVSDALDREEEKNDAEASKKVSR